MQRGRERKARKFVTTNRLPTSRRWSHSSDHPWPPIHEISRSRPPVRQEKSANSNLAIRCFPNDRSKPRKPNQRPLPIRLPQRPCRHAVRSARCGGNRRLERSRCDWASLHGRRWTSPSPETQAPDCHRLARPSRLHRFSARVPHPVALYGLFHHPSGIFAMPNTASLLSCPQR
ncbi:hypothetical protein K227x_29630 [Rubripirellula lacrimiformis]|uniref:Uncharacterized protein n=1 Tax=Rubripirellula lacrimiformis TaxID=1930273 RepID=A0A517NBT8_9BACT|nr:hypothetical protein K227x_29630 [Rubripirellula lacrimiformis]